MENTVLKKLSSFFAHNWLKAIKFGLTGGLGTITNLALFFLFADTLGCPDIAVNIGCFIFAGTQNYFINHAWTFREQCAEKVSLALWARFMSSSLAGYAVNLGVYLLLSRIWEWPYKVIPQAIGILAGMTLNFIFSNYLVFGKKRAD